MKTRRKRSRADRIRHMLEQGATTREIVAKLRIKPQQVYNVRYHMNKSKGLGAIAPQPAEQAGTGIAALPEMPTRLEVTLAPLPPMVGSVSVVGSAVTRQPLPPEPPPTLWQRVKNWFTRGSHERVS